MDDRSIMELPTLHRLPLCTGGGAGGAEEERICACYELLGYPSRFWCQLRHLSGQLAWTWNWIGLFFLWTPGGFADHVTFFFIVWDTNSLCIYI